MTQSSRKARRGGTRDGLFQQRGWWWIDYHDAEGKRHRKKAAPDHQTAKTIYRDPMTKIARGEVLGIREEGTTLRTFVDKRYWPAVKSTVASSWAIRTRGIFDKPSATVRRPDPDGAPARDDRGLVQRALRPGHGNHGEQRTRPTETLPDPRGRVAVPPGKPGGTRSQGEGVQRPDPVSHRRGADPAS